MTVLLYINAGIMLFGLVLMLAVILELRQGRRDTQAILKAIIESGEEQRAHREAMMTHATKVLRTALDDGAPRTIVVTQGAPGDDLS